MAQEIIDQEGSVGRVIFGSAIGKRFAVAGQPCWRQREQHQEVVLEQCIRDAPARLLETNGDWPATKSLTQTAGPLVDGLGCLGQLAVLGPPATLIVEHQVVFLVGPIEPDERGKYRILGRHRRRNGDHGKGLQQVLVNNGRTRWLWFGEVLIDRRISEDRLRLRDSLQNQSASSPREGSTRKRVTAGIGGSSRGDACFRPGPSTYRLTNAAFDGRKVSRAMPSGDLGRVPPGIGGENFEGL